MLMMPRGGIRLKMVVMSLPLPIQLLPYGWTKRTFTKDPPGVIAYPAGMLNGLPLESKRKGPRWRNLLELAKVVHYYDRLRAYVDHDRRKPMEIATEFIKLDSFLKAVNVAGSGGEAKILIADGQVLVNGELELRRGRKLRPGDRVEVAGHCYRVEEEGNR